MSVDFAPSDGDKRREALEERSRELEQIPRHESAADWEEDYGEDEPPRRSGSRRKKNRSVKRDSSDSRSGEPGPRRRGTVVTVRKQRCRVASGNDLVTAWLSAEMAAEQKSAIAVGDEVILERRDRDWVVVEVLPRRSTLSRPDPFSPEKERVVAANVDVVVQVSAAKEPPLKTGLIDRYLIAIERGGARPVVCINKIDQVSAEEREDVETILDDYRRLGIPIVFCSAVAGDGLEQLRREVEGKTAVLVGHSGVGKSSLLTALDEELRIATKELHSGGRSGRHTTTSSTLYEFPDGTRLIDTPGIREFGLFQIDREDLRFFFEEFEEYAPGCRFRNCTHLHEPDCAVKAAAAEGEISRYERYRRMAEEL
ncbi:MAG: ribosome small subunit-dependent GTPase A [Thermoanaerobaculia bacterium]|nr:ribosome small subunit-dependent GTPase A [Thermoanaerobaculia bacterium]